MGEGLAKDGNGVDEKAGVVCGNRGGRDRGRSASTKFLRGDTAGAELNRWMSANNRARCWICC